MILFQAVPRWMWPVVYGGPSTKKKGGSPAWSDRTFA